MAQPVGLVVEPVVLNRLGIFPESATTVLADWQQRLEQLLEDQPEGVRQDAVSYCLQALQLFEGMEQQRFMAVLSEVAAMGQGGLQINEPGTSRILKTLPGSWSDLALACLIHVGM